MNLAGWVTLIGGVWFVVAAAAALPVGQLLRRRSTQDTSAPLEREEVS